MKKNKLIAALLTATIGLSACVPHSSQSNYNEADVGRNAVIFYGRVVSQRSVDITGHNTGIGAGAGAGAGALAGSYIGQGRGGIAALVGGALIGGIAGQVAEQSLQDRKGIEYIIRFYPDNATRSVVQNIAKDDMPIAIGECVMVQQSGTYQRVLPAPADTEECDKVKVKRHKQKGELKPSE